MIVAHHRKEAKPTHKRSLYEIIKIPAVFLASTCLTLSAMAEVTVTNVTQPVGTSQAKVTFDNGLNNSLDNTDLSYAFGGSQDLYIQAMT